MAFHDSYTMTSLSEPDRDRLLALERWAFPSFASEEEAQRMPITWDRTVAVVERRREGLSGGADGGPDGPLVAAHTSHPYRAFPVPGAEIPVAGLTSVCVHPQHRRQGILSSMIDRHLADCLARGEAVSALFATEPAIYGRFGYGSAARELSLTLPRGAALHPVEGADALTVRLETLDPAVHGELVSALHAEAGRRPVGVDGINRPGWVTRESDDQKAFHLDNTLGPRDEREPRRIVIVESDGQPRGYTTFRRKIGWGHTGPNGTVTTGEVVALDPAAAHRLWSTVLDLDLTHQVEASNIALDDPITSLLVDLRSTAPRLADNLWVRLVDVPAALAARQYTRDLDVRLQVTDPRLPTNTATWRLEAPAFGAATVTRTDASPDLSMSVTELGAAYLGGTSLASIAGAGRVTEHTGGTLLRTSSAFLWPVAPASSWIY